MVLIFGITNKIAAESFKKNLQIKRSRQHAPVNVFFFIVTI
jgi:hypothetical protein